ncbi:MAG: two-component system regulatory protein YycI [Firmicutes bacterium]|nr:two-component system regulatory protein YycI [Bacillota bacterium]
MNWKRAKNFMMICLIALNIVLFYLNITNSGKYIITDERKNAIFDFAEKNNIKINADIPEEFMPDRQINIKRQNYDIMELQNIFFNNTNGLKRTEEFDKTIIVDDDESILIQNNTVSYERNSYDENFELTEEKARETGDYFLKRIGEKFVKLDADRMIKDGTHYTMTYSQKLNDMKIFNNYLTVDVYEDGFISARFTYSPVGEITGVNADICSADEALFVFINEIGATRDNDDGIVIDKMDYGYYAFAEDINGTVTAVPHYRIFIEGEDMPYYINAYSARPVDSNSW